MRKVFSLLILVTAALAAQTYSLAAEPAPKPLHFKVDHGVQQTVFGQLHQFEGL